MHFFHPMSLLRRARAKPDTKSMKLNFLRSIAAALLIAGSTLASSGAWAEQYESGVTRWDVKDGKLMTPPAASSPETS